MKASMPPTLGIITTSFPRHDRHGAGRFIFESCCALSNLGYALDIIIPSDTSACTLGIPQSWQLHEVSYAWPARLQQTFYRAGIPENCAQAPWKSTGLLTYAWQLRKHIQARHTHWDAMLSHWLIPNAWVAGWVNKNIRRPIPHIAYAHSSDLSALYRIPGSKRLALSLANSASSIVFPTRWQAEQFRNWIPGADADLHVNPMGCNLSVPTLSSAQLKRRLCLPHWTIMWMGRWVDIKNPTLAVHAAAGLAARTATPIHLVMAGEGPLGPAIRQLARQRNVDLRDVGWLDATAKREYLQASDVFLFTSHPSRSLRVGPLRIPRAEGLPVVLIEAMASGLPIVAIESASVRELIEHEQEGLLVPAESLGALVDALQYLYQHPERTERLARQAKVRAANYTWASWAQRIKSLLSRDRLAKKIN